MHFISSKSSGTRNPAFGFTLIELLVVIAIISLLAAILFPVFGRARENGRRASCSSNLRQVGLGFQQYTQDYDEKYPIYRFPQGTIFKGWAENLQPYVKSTQVFQCPSDKFRDTSMGWEAIGGKDWPADFNYSDYYYNATFQSVAGSDSFPSGTIKGSILSNASVTVLAGEGYNGGSTYQEYEPALVDTDNRDGSSGGWDDNTSVPARRHLDTGNYLFADGHVKSLRVEKVAGCPVTGWTATSKNCPVTPDGLNGYAAVFAHSGN